jgi:hypothetical protein
MPSIVFFNHWHYGDLFSTRGLVADIKRQLQDYNFVYAHNRNPWAVADLCKSLSRTPADKILNQMINMRIRFAKNGDDLFINTWVGAYEGLWGSNTHPSYISHHKIFEECYKGLNQQFGTNLKLDSDVWTYVPEIDYSPYNTKTADDFLASVNRCHLICNGAVQSTQSSMGNMQTIIETLAAKYPNDTFVATELFETTMPNIYFTDNIFQKTCDMCEISYLSTKVDVVAGKNSGPFTYANTKQNLHNPNKKLICFSHKLEDTLPHGLDFAAEFIFSDTINDSTAVEIIEKAINE